MTISPLGFSLNTVDLRGKGRSLQKTMIKHNNNIDLKIIVCYFCFYESVKLYIQFVKKIAERRELWHATCFQILCQPDDFIQNFIDIIPNKINPDHKQSPKDFTRNRDLPFPKLIAFTLSIAYCRKGS